MSSVNQLNAQIKIQEVWKALNIKDYPIQLEKYSVNNTMISTRANWLNLEIVQSPKRHVFNDAVRLLNQLPNVINSCDTISQVKKQ